MKVIEKPVLLPALDRAIRRPAKLAEMALGEALWRPPETVHVAEVRDRGEFMRLRAEWDALVAASGREEPFYRHEFIRVWLDNFAPGGTLRVLVGRNGAGSLVAALPLLEERARMMGAPVRRLASASNDHSCRFDMVVRGNMGEIAGQAFFDYLSADDSWDVLRLTDVPQGGQAWHLYEAAKENGYPTEAWESLRSPYISLPSSGDEISGRLPAKFRANLRRRRRKLEERGRVTVERVTGGLELQGKLEEGYALERSGWKGEQGTAISQSSDTWGFYSELARVEAYRDALSLYFLCLDGEPVAFQYGLAQGGRYFLLKPGYNQAYAECSPGQLLMSEVINDRIRLGTKEFDFLGPDMEWKRAWTDETRMHSWLYIFRANGYGRTLHRARFRWGKLAKELITLGSNT